MTEQSPAEGGQALVELMGIVVICLMIGFGIYEAGVLFHNVSVINQSMETASLYAAQGARMDKIQDLIYDEAGNLMGGALLEQRIIEADEGSNIIVEIWNPATDEPLVTEYTPNQEEFGPRMKNVAPYMFWAQGYEIRVGVYYQIGIYVPFLKAFEISLPIVGSRTIDAPNDIDRDGMVDSREVEYIAYDIYPDEWEHPKHRDNYDTMDTTSGAEIDGDLAVETVQTCGLVVTRICGGGSSQCGDGTTVSNEHYVEVFNPGPVRYELDEIEICDYDGSTCNPREFDNISTELEVEDYFLIASDTAVSVKADTTNANLELNPANDGVAVYNPGGTRCDAVGYGAMDVAEYYEEETAAVAGSYPELVRMQNGEDLPIDRNHNEDDIHQRDSFMTLKQGFEEYREYDYDNDDRQDKFDPGNGQNQMFHNPVVGPSGWSSLP